MRYKLISNLSTLADTSDDLAAEVLEETVQFILTLIRLYVPVRTGKLRDSHEIEKQNKLSILIGTTVLYSVWVNFGSSRQSANPYFTSAFTQAESYFKTRLMEKLSRV